MLSLRIGRMAPHRFATAPYAVDPLGRAFWRNLVFAAVPVAASTSGKQVGFELVFRKHGQGGGTVVLGGDAYGPTFRCVASGVGFAGTRPTATPFAAFGFVTRKDGSDATLQSLVGNGASGFNGWTLQLNYGAQEIGLTRWGIADNKTTTLGAVPKQVASGIGLSHDGSTARFMLNGRFQDVASGSINGTTASVKTIGANVANAAPCQNASIHVVYCWERTLTDAELLTLWRDPWLPLRPAGAMLLDGAGGGGGTGARSFVPAFIG